MAQSNQKKLTTFILISLVLGLFIGLILHSLDLGHLAEYVKPVGKAFISLLKMMIVPLVLASIFTAIVNLGSPKELGSLGFKAILYYTITTAIAAFIGLVFVNLINPGEGLDLGTMQVAELTGTIKDRVDSGSASGLVGTIMNVFLDAIPTNPFQALAEAKILQVIVFAMLFGVTCLFMRKESEPLVSFMDSLEKISMGLVNGIMYLAPIGIFALTVQVISETGFDALSALGKYMGTVLIGLLCHFIVLLIIASWRSKKSPIFIFKTCLSPILTAFSTSSSAATLPVTMKTVEEDLGVDKKTAQFVLPLGATINMDGTALYESVAVIFIGQAYGLDIGIANQVVIFLTASLAAIGAAAIPGAGLVTMSIVLTAVGFPLDGIGLILAVDRILDMFRTAVNVFGDCVGTLVVESIGKKTS